MKKTVLSIVAVTCLSLTCCKKERTCTCTVNERYPIIFSPSSYTGTYTYKRVTKKQLKTLCVSYAETNSDGYTKTVDCELK